MIDAPYETNLYLHCFWKTCLIKETYTFLYSVVIDEVPSTSSQTDEQFAHIQEGDTPGASKLNDWHYTRNKEIEHNFLPKNTLGKEKMDLMLSIIFAITPVDVL